MKKYYNEQGEQFKLTKGTIEEIKNYVGRVSVYMYQDEDSKKWHMSFSKGWIDREGREFYGICIDPWMKKITTKEVAHICGYWDEK